MAVNYYEMIIKGDQNVFCAYMQGFLYAKRIGRGVFFSNNCPLQIQHLRDLIKYHGEVIHLVCRAGLRAMIASAIRNAPANYSFEIKKMRRISSASFTFEFETFNRKIAGNIKRPFTRLPAGLKLKNYKPHEKIDPSAAGPEGYAPAHEYRFWGKGTVTGDIEALLGFHQKLSQNDFIELEDVFLRY